jgi:hypothetical protein
MTAPVVAIEPGSGTALLLRRLARPYDAARAVAALAGVSPRTATRVVGAAVAGSAEAEALLHAMPHIVRAMAIATTDRPERCYGELRGPVLWSETMSGRSASAGDPGLFVCSTTTRAYDTDENRVLKAALAAVERAGQDASAGATLDDDVRHARHNQMRARHLLEHRTLSGVPLTRIGGRTLQRTRNGSRRNTYAPAVALLLRAADPLRPEHLAPIVDDAARAGHDLLATGLLALDELQRDGALRTSSGTLVAGPLRYEAGAGVTVDGRLVATVEDLRAALA